MADVDSGQADAASDELLSSENDEAVEAQPVPSVIVTSALTDKSRDIVKVVFLRDKVTQRFNKANSTINYRDQRYVLTSLSFNRLYVM